MPKRPRPSYQVDESSSSGGETDNSRVGDSDYDPQPSPKKKADVQSTIRTSQKVKLGGLDGCSCLVTGETDGQCIEVCHILRRREHEDDLKRYQKCFGMKETIFIDSVKNLIHLRADWHQSFDAGCWALVPTMEDLEDIVRRLESGKKWQFLYLDAKQRDYQFISFPSLGQKPIHRATETRDKYERIAYDDVPLLRSHIHPYYVIANAIPKFRRAVLTPSLRRLSGKLAQIDDLWQTLPTGQTASGAGTSHLGGAGGGGSGGGGKHGSWGRDGKHGDGGGGGGKRGSGGRDGKHGDGRDGGGKLGYQSGKTRGHNDNGVDGKVRMAGRNGAQQAHVRDAGDKSLHGSCGDLNKVQGAFPASTSSGGSGDCDPGASDGDFLDDQRKAVVDWREQVMKAGPSEPAGVQWKVRKRARRRYREDWGDWKPTFSPADRSKFTSNDWAMYWKSFNLPRRRP